MTFVYMISALVVLGLHFASALPQNKLVARDDSGSCTKFTLEQAKSLPGWPKFKQYATDTYGTGDMDIVFNPPEYPAYPALICLDTKPISVAIEGKPDCTEQTSRMAGVMTGTTGSATLSYQQGYSSSGSWTSALGSGITLTASIGVPGNDFSTAVSATTTFTNSLTQSFSASVSNQQMETITFNAPDNRNCVATMSTTTCNGGGTGEALYTLSGNAWFFYKRARAPKSDPKGEKHYKWTSPIANMLSADELSSPMRFSGKMQMTSQANFSANCAYTPIVIV
ncbi:hypothetical protein M413DRAFT_31284 [Hebeloma cylindrosporum]|uniref:Uncharacterized protein n=1 Tax=Hebeloma cylindrosporum TaxID=76867 RepID=A0A0C3BZL1_HEBCY|nr:hypothetical protein M413DRAFT_31284 [Hebeloma cylindrosporum h7]